MIVLVGKSVGAPRAPSYAGSVRQSSRLDRESRAVGTIRQMHARASRHAAYALDAAYLFSSRSSFLSMEQWQSTCLELPTRTHVIGPLQRDETLDGAALCCCRNGTQSGEPTDRHSVSNTEPNRVRLPAPGRHNTGPTHCRRCGRSKPGRARFDSSRSHCGCRVTPRVS